MIWNIAKKELILNLVSFKFVVAIIICVLLTVILMPVLISDYERRLQEYHQNKADTEATLRKAGVYRNFHYEGEGRYMMHRPPAKALKTNWPIPLR